MFIINLHYNFRDFDFNNTNDIDNRVFGLIENIKNKDIVLINYWFENFILIVKVMCNQKQIEEVKQSISLNGFFI